MNGAVHQDDLNSIRMVGPGHHGTERWHSRRAAFGLRDPIDDRRGRTLARHRRVRGKQRIEGRFVALAIDPLAVCAVLLEIAAESADVGWRIGHRLRWIRHGRVAKVRRVRLALGESERLRQAVRELRRSQRLIMAECTAAPLAGHWIENEPRALIRGVIRWNMNYVANRVEAWRRADFRWADKALHAHRRDGALRAIGLIEVDILV